MFYSWLVGASLLLVPIAPMGWFYTIAATVRSADFSPRRATRCWPHHRGECGADAPVPLVDHVSVAVVPGDRDPTRSCCDGSFAALSHVLGCRRIRRPIHTARTSQVSRHQQPAPVILRVADKSPGEAHSGEIQARRTDVRGALVTVSEASTAGPMNNRTASAYGQLTVRTSRKGSDGRQPHPRWWSGRSRYCRGPAH